MASRAIWKGHMALGDFFCAVTLHSAASTAERVAFHLISSRTGNRLRRAYVDPETGEEVGREDQVRGYETEPGRFVPLEGDEIAAALPEGDKTLRIETFLPCDQVDLAYFDKPYRLRPADAAAGTGFALFREGIRREKAAALARAVLFRRVRTVLIRALEEELIAHTLRFDYEIRPAEAAFANLRRIGTKGEMLELAEHIIETRRGRFDPAAFDDRYDAALADLVRAKAEGRALPSWPRKAPPETADLLGALRASAKPAPGRRVGGRKSVARPAPRRRKTG